MPRLFKCCPECPGDQSCPEAKYCMCGSEMEAHGMGSGHSPVSMHDYCSREEPEAEEMKPAVCSKCGKTFKRFVPDDAADIICFACDNTVKGPKCSSTLPKPRTS